MEEAGSTGHESRKGTKKGKGGGKSWWKRDPYKSKLAKKMRTVKTSIQFCIGAVLIFILSVKGITEVLQTFDVIKEERLWPATGLSPLVTHILSIHTFGYIASALAISAGIDLGYMLFTDGPDEALTPLMLCISSAAVYTISNRPEQNRVVGIYVLCIAVLLVCQRMYDKWDREKAQRKKDKKIAKKAQNNRSSSGDGYC